MKRKNAFTLVEVLVVVAILLVLVGIVLSVFLVGKERSKVVVDMSNLHQIGLAAAIYASDHDEQPALSTLPLLQGGYISDKIVVSPTDETEHGLAIEFRKGIGLPVDNYLATAPKITYIGPGEGDWPLFVYREKVAELENPGWLIDLTRGEREDAVDMTEGRYQRLLLDTSVVTRHMEPENFMRNGAPGRRFRFERYFADFPPAP